MASRRDFLKAAIAFAAVSAIPVSKIEAIVESLSDVQIAQGFNAASFSALLREYLPYELFREELMKRDWFFKNIESDSNWSGGTVHIPIAK